MNFSRDEADKLGLLNVALGVIYFVIFLSIAFTDCGEFWRDTKIVLLFLLGLAGMFQAFMAWLGVIQVN